jgi:hypothetical protein
MTDRVKVTITGYYALPDDPVARAQAYHTMDRAECVAIDARTNPVDLLAACDGVTMTVELATGDPWQICVCGTQRRHHLSDGTIRPTPWSDDTCDGFQPAGETEQ